MADIDWSQTKFKAADGNEVNLVELSRGFGQKCYDSTMAKTPPNQEKTVSQQDAADIVKCIQESKKGFQHSEDISTAANKVVSDKEKVENAAKNLNDLVTKAVKEGKNAVVVAVADPSYNPMSPFETKPHDDAIAKNIRAHGFMSEMVTGTISPTSDVGNAQDSSGARKTYIVARWAGPSFRAPWW